MTIPTIATYPMPELAALPESRVDWTPQAQRAVLLVHDMQQYFIDFFDVQAAPIPALLSHIRALIEACTVVGVPVVFTAQPAVQSAEQRGVLQSWWGPGVTAHPERAAIVEALRAQTQHAIVLDKWRYSAFSKSDLLQRLRDQGRDQLIVCGVYAHIGCMLTVADAFMNDVQPFLVGDAVADFSLEQHTMALNYVSQRCGVVMAHKRVIECLGRNRGLPLNIEDLRAEVAVVLELPASDLLLDDNLLYEGLDSIRLMSLVERWQRAGCKLGFVELAAQPTLLQWWAMFQAHREGGKP